MKCTPLFCTQKNFPNCPCGGVETTSHYILHCPRFADIRQELILSISNIPVNITINLLLFGTNELTDEQNTLIFVSMQKYIIKSKRFTPWSYGLPYFSDVHLALKLIISYHFSLLSSISHTFILLYQIIIFPGRGSCVHIARHVHVALCGLSDLDSGGCLIINYQQYYYINILIVIDIFYKEHAIIVMIILCMFILEDRFIKAIIACFWILSVFTMFDVLYFLIIF